MLIAIDHGNKQVKTVHGNAIVYLTKKQNQTLRQGYTEIRRQLLYAVSAAYPVPEGQNHRRAVLYPVAICHCGGNRSTERLYFRADAH